MYEEPATSEASRSQGALKMESTAAEPASVEEIPIESARPAVDWRRGPWAFALLWFGQSISMLGSGLAQFGFRVWIFQQTESATQFGLVAIFGNVPTVLLLPFAGVVIDRFDRGRILALSNAFSGGVALAAAGIIAAGRFERWHLYVIAFLIASASAFQWPAFSASTPLMVPKQHLARASGMVQMAIGASQIVAPLVGGALLPGIGLQGLLLLDVVSFAVVILVIAIIRIPRPPRVAGESSAQKRSLRDDLRFGLDYLRERPALLSLLLIFAGINFAFGLVQTTLTPLILTQGDTVLLGRVLAAAALGLFLGGLGMSVWGGPKRKALGILVAIGVGGLFVIGAGLSRHVGYLGASICYFAMLFPVMIGCSQAIWQTKIEPGLQGRLFSIRQLVATASLPIAFGLGGPLADYVFEPAMAEGGVLAGVLGPVLGVGKGRGLALMLVLCGLLIVAIAVRGLRNRPLLRVEQELPDAVGGDVPPRVATVA